MSAEAKPVPPSYSDSRFLQDAHVLWELLEFAPVSLWIEDWSGVKRTLDGWRKAGIADPVAHAAAENANLEALARAVRVIDVNATSVSVYRAPDKASLIASHETHSVKTLCNEMREFFLDALAAFVGRAKHVGVEAWDVTFDNRPIRVHISCSIAPHDTNWERAVLAIKDVTEAWQVREALDASRDMLAQAASLARLAHWIRDDASGAIIHCGDEIEPITGRTPGEWATLLGSGSVEACIAPDDRATYRAAVPAGGGHDGPYTVEYRLWRPDGSERWVRECGAPLRQSSGTNRRFLCTLQDITEQRLVELARRSVEAQFQGFLENAPFSMFVKDHDRRYIYANRRTVARLGRPLEDVIGHRPEELLPPEAAEIYREEDNEVLATHAPVIRESRVRGPTGEIWAELIRFPIFDEAGAVRAIGGMAIDITEIKRAEQALREQHEFLRLVIDSAAAYIMVFDGAGHLVACNKALQTFCGASLEELQQDEGWTKRISPEDLPAVREMLAIDDPAKFPNHDLTRGIRMDGDVRLIHWVNAALTGPDGKIRNIISIGTDVTEQDRAEKALRESEARLKAFIDNAPFEMFLKDAEGRYLMANDHVAAVLGVPLSRLLGHRVGEFSANANAEIYADHDQAVFESGQPVTRRTSWNAPDGTHWTQEMKFPVRSATGQMTGIGGIGIDITQQMRTEEALRESEARWRAFKDNAPFVIFYKDPQGRYVDVNRQSEIFWKRTTGEIVGRTTAEIEKAGEGQKFIRQDEEVVRTGKPVMQEFHFPGNPLGEWVRDLKFPIFDRAGNIIAIGGIGTDITDVKRAQQALQQSEANLRAVVEGIVEGIVIFDANGSIRSISRATERLLGCRAAELTGRDLGALFPQFAGDGCPAFVNEIESWIGKSQELEAVARNGQRLNVAFSVNELPPSDGVRQFIGTILDLTSHKMLEERLRQAQKMETIGQFTGGIAHDFNNLLAVIIGNLDLLGSRVSEDRSRKLVERASGAAQRGADLTKRLLAFARRQRLEPAPVDLASLIHEMIPMVERAVGPEIDIRPVVVDGLWNALVDRVQLEAALLNLIGNARDAMPNGGELVIRTANHEITSEAGEIGIRLRRGRYVEIAVVDSGTGMSPEVLQRAFEPFFTTKGVGRGTGLGLSMVHGFIQQSGGDVRISSTAGKGTTICLYLPATDRAQDAAEVAAPEADSADRGGQRILVVDDEPEVVTLVKDLLGGLGYRVDTAATGADALEQLKQPVEYDLLLTDVRMKGGMSGPQLVVKAREMRPELRVLYMSGYDDAQGPQGGVPGGASLLHKPFRNGDLALAIVRALSA